MTRVSGIRLAVIAVLLGACFALAPQAGATSHPQQSHTSSVVSVHAAATPPAGPSINQRQKDADAAQNRTKAILAVACLALLVIIYFGRRSRRKHRKRLGDLQNAKA